MSKKKRKVVFKPKTLPQLWIAEREINGEKRRIYVYADRWFDVRECAGMKLLTNGNYQLLFISAVMGHVDFKDHQVFLISYSGSAPNLEKRIDDITKQPWLREAADGSKKEEQRT